MALVLPSLAALVFGDDDKFSKRRRFIGGDETTSNVRVEEAESIINADSGVVLGVVSNQIVAYNDTAQSPLVLLANAQTEVAKMIENLTLKGKEAKMCGGYNCFEANVTAMTHPSIHALVKFLWADHPTYAASLAKLDLSTLGVRFPKVIDESNDSINELRLHTIASTSGFGAEILCSFSAKGEGFDSNSGRVYVYATGWTDLFTTIDSWIFDPKPGPKFDLTMLDAIDNSTKSASAAFMLLTDLKIENILVRYDKNDAKWECKFIDFDPAFSKLVGPMKGEREYAEYGYDVAYFFNTLFFANNVCKELSKLRTYIRQNVPESRQQRWAESMFLREVALMARPVGLNLQDEIRDWLILKKEFATPFLNSMNPKNTSEELIKRQLNYNGWEKEGKSVWADFSKDFPGTLFDHAKVIVSRLYWDIAEPVIDRRMS
jgi:hypothetical protein